MLVRQRSRLALRRTPAADSGFHGVVVGGLHASALTCSCCGSQCDIYSYGVILWEIITGAPATRGRLYEPEVRVPPLPPHSPIAATCRLPHRNRFNLYSYLEMKGVMGTLIRSQPQH